MHCIIHLFDCLALLLHSGTHSKVADCTFLSLLLFLVVLLMLLRETLADAKCRHSALL